MPFFAYSGFFTGSITHKSGLSHFRKGDILSRGLKVTSARLFLFVLVILCLFVVSPVVAAPPVASFYSTPTDGIAPLTVQFNDTSTNVPTSWSWSFGEGNTSTLQDPMWTYESIGNYTVNLTVTNIDGSDTVTHFIHVSDVNADFTWTCNATTPYKVDFQSTSTTGFPPIDSLWWSFGDGGTDLPNHTSPSHTYASTSPMNVTLQVWDMLGVESDRSRIVTPCEPPFISATVNRSVAPAGSVFLFSGTNTYGDSPGYYTNIFVTNATSGGTLPANGVRPDNFGISTITGNNATFHQATVISGGWSYAWDTSTITGGSLLPGSLYRFYLVNESLNTSSLYSGTYTRVEVAIEGPLTANYSVNTASGTAPLSVTFTDLTSGYPETYNLSFGDGTWFNATSMGPVTHTYSSTGTYSPALYVTNSLGSAYASYTPITVSLSTTGGGGTGGGGGDSSPPSAPVVPQPSTAAPPAVNPVAPAPAATLSYPLGFEGLTYNADGQGTLSINLANAKAAGATVTTYFNRVEVYQHHSPGVTTTFWGDHFMIGNGSVSGRVIKAEFVTDPLNTTLDYGPVTGSVKAVLPALTHPGWVNNTIAENASADTRDKFTGIARANGLSLQDIAYTLAVKKNGITTGPANITFTIPAAWVNSHGGPTAVHITRISEETGKTELLATTYVGLDPHGNVIFQGDSPNGTSLFGLVTAEATSVAQKQNPNTTYVPASKSAMITDVGMLGWIAGCIENSPLLIALAIVILALALYFGWWRRRL